MPRYTGICLIDSWGVRCGERCNTVKTHLSPGGLLCDLDAIFMNLLLSTPGELEVVKIAVLVQALTFCHRVSAKFWVEIFAITPFNTSKTLVVSVFAVSETAWRMFFVTGYSIYQFFACQAMGTVPGFICSTDFTANLWLIGF